MRRKGKKELTWKRVYKANQRAIKLIYTHYPKMVLSRLIYTVWTALAPYVGIYCSALIIGELAGGKDAGKLAELVLFTLITEAAIAFVSALLLKWQNSEGGGMYQYFQIQQIFTKKLLDMDFVKIDEEKTHEMLSSIEQYQNGGGWGLISLIRCYEVVLSSVFTFLGGITLTVSLFTSTVPESAGAYQMLNHPLFIALIIFVMLAVTWLSPVLATKAGEYWAKNADKHNQENRIFRFYSFFGHRPEIAADVRIYRQDLIGAKNMVLKTGVFESKGLFAGYARGPMGFYNAASAAVSVLFTGVIYLFVCLKAWAGAFGIGSVTQYAASVTKAASGLSSLIEIAGTMRNNTFFLEKTFEFLDIPNPMYQGSLTVEKRRDRDYEVEFRSVSFQYPGSTSYALKNVSMKFRIGERLAVVGRNGSGKTTFIKLLCRLYDPTEGEILLNGINIRKYNYLDYLSIFSVVFQDFKLFSFPLGQNVAASCSYDKEQVISSLRKAGFGERLSELPDGTETYLYKDFSENGVDISGGEAQKIALARSLYKDSPFIILDEPTAALDPVAEADIYTRFNEVVGDKTAIYISHRLSSCQFCDEIAVFDNGEIVQQGSHEKLVEDEEGKYYELWRAQAQYYTE